MFGCKNAIRTLNQIKNRTTLNHLNASASLILFNNPIMCQNVQNRNVHLTNNQLQFDTLKSILKNYWYDLSMIIKQNTISGTKIQQATVYMVESSLDNIDFVNWFRYFELDDNIGSWHLVTMIHNWMCLVKISEPGRDSEYFKRQYILRMQEDLRARINALGIFPEKEKNRFINECHYTFNASIIAYDEGLLNTDRELAASVWRTFFQKKCTDYTKLEVLVHYIRVQLQHLSTIKNEDLFCKHIEWKKFNFPK